MLAITQRFRPRSVRGAAVYSGLSADLTSRNKRNSSADKPEYAAAVSAGGVRPARPDIREPRTRLGCMGTLQISRRCAGAPLNEACNVSRLIFEGPTRTPCKSRQVARRPAAPLLASTAAGRRSSPPVVATAGRCWRRGHAALSRPAIGSLLAAGTRRIVTPCHRVAAGGGDTPHCHALP